MKKVQKEFLKQHQDQATLDVICQFNGWECTTANNLLIISDIESKKIKYIGAIMQ